MKRGKPLKRDRPIRLMSVKKRRKTDRYVAFRRTVFERSEGLCERCFGIIDVITFECHHRLRRAQGGKDTHENCVALCQHCHRDVHDHVSAAMEAGWLVPMGVDPATVVPVPVRASA